jgi:photosystem II stability/assembly factor-like uncharacterized protein
MASWKKYGGKDKFENMNNLTVNTLVCENFVMRNQYFGDWKFTGSLDVAQGSIVRGDAYFYKNVDISGNVIVRGKIFVLSTDISGTVTVSEDIDIKRNIYLGPDSVTKSIISGTNNMIGINKQNTELYATLDISGNIERTIDIHAYVPNNKNVIARNINDQGITVNVEPTRAYIDFYVDNSMNLTTENRGGRILYEPGGFLTVDASSAFRVLPTAVFSRQLSDVALGNESVTIFDSTNNVAPYLYYYYNDLSYNSGDAVNIVSVDYSSNVFLTLRNRGGTGLAVGGGYLPGNMIMGSLALTDADNVKHTAMNIISGNLSRQLRASIGVNKHNVLKDSEGINKYAMEVNGPVRIEHQELNVAAETTFEILGQCFYDNSGFAFGTPTKEGSLFNQYILTTSDGGFTWARKKIVKTSVDDLEISDIVFSAGYSSKTEPLYLIGGEQNYLYYSNDYGTNWTSITVSSVAIVNIQTLYLSPNKTHLIIGGIFGSDYRILNSDAFPSGTVSTNVGSRFDVNLNPIVAIDGFDNTYAYIIGGGGIRKYNMTNNTYTSVVGSGTYYGMRFYYDGVKYHSIIVGVNSISYSHDVVAGSWTTISIGGSTLRSVYIVNATRAFAVGDGGAILFSLDGYTTWKKFTYDELNSMGNADRLWNTNLKNIWARGTSDLIITGTIANYVSGTVVGKSYIFDLFSPYFFDHDAYNVFELSGNMVMSGDLRINDLGRLMTNNSSFYILPENASQIYIGNTAVGGKTNILNNLDVCGNMTVFLDASFNSDFYVKGESVFYSDVSMLGNLEVSQNTASDKIALGKKTIDTGYTVDISGSVKIQNGFIHQW